MRQCVAVAQTPPPWQTQRPPPARYHPYPDTTGIKGIPTDETQSAIAVVICINRQGWVRDLMCRVEMLEHATAKVENLYFRKYRER